MFLDHGSVKNQSKHPPIKIRLRMKSYLTTLTFNAMVVAFATTTFGQGTVITYQARLAEGTNEVNGLYDIRAELYNRAIPGEPGDTQIGSAVSNMAVPVVKGLFTVTLDFGAGVFTGESRWLQLSVRTNNASSFSVLLPRQSVRPTPYAILSGNVAGTVAAASLPTGGNWALSSALTLDTSTLAVDPVNNRVGIGTASPAWPLHEVAGQSVALLESTATPFGSVLELRNNTVSPTYLGAINFNNAAGTYPGQIGYLNGNMLTFRTAGADRMTLNSAGNLSVTASAGTAITASSLASGVGFGVRGEGSFLGVGVDGWAPDGSSYGVRGQAGGTNSAGVYAEAFATSTETYGVRGKAHSGLGSGVAGENNASTGIGVYGLQGSGTGSRTAAGVYGESLQASGNGVVGVANNGSAAYGIWGRSSSGYAGAFEGAVKVFGNSSHTKPFLQLHETEDGDYARIQLQVASRPLWHIAVGGADNSLVLYNSTNSIVTSVSESGTLTTRVLTITGGADIAEPFQMSQRDLRKGSVVVIDEENPGRLKLSTEPYDRRVAGIISGAGGVNPGLSLQQEGVVEGDQQVALTGRVFAQADTSNGPIKPGDLLTTSPSPGRAMRVTDHARAQGAILGKALSALAEGDGLVLVLVTLQ
jgi:hypothetical protein